MPRERELWERIQAFQLDAEGVSFPFSAKLRKETGWTEAYTARAIEEYKRFAYLAVAAGHPVSPSRAVDEVWHMHLQYTRSYWEEFCPKEGTGTVDASGTLRSINMRGSRGA